MKKENNESHIQMDFDWFHYRGGKNYSALLERASQLRRQQTSAESMFWQMVRNRGFMGLKFRRQHQIGQYIADFYCNELRLVVELDGDIHNKQLQKDNCRDDWMKSMGFKVLRFNNEDLQYSIDKVLQAMHRIAVERRLM